MSSSLVRKLLLLSAFCFVLEAYRIVSTGTISYIFLPWNLLLAWVPFFIARLVCKEQNTFKISIYFGGWLVFFPNAPYLITDLIHLKPRNNFPLWFDSILLYSFAFCGLIVGILSAVMIYRKLKEIIPGIIAKALMLSAMLISGYGVYIGRFLRWNSWNLLTNPLGILSDTAIRIIDPLSYPRTYGLTILTGTLLCLVFLIFESLTQKEPA